MRAAYGSEDYQYNKQLIHNANTFNLEVMAVLKTGALLVGIVHSLQYVPSWFPGAGWKRALKRVALLGERVKTDPFEMTKEKIVCQSLKKGVEDRLTHSGPILSRIAGSSKART